MQKLKMQPSIRSQFRLALFTAILAFCVVLVGAYVRLSDAGLGCPDWPGCYGSLIVPEVQEGLDDAWADRPLQSAKAWKEMVHRYLAGALGLTILLLAILAWRNRRYTAQPLLLPSLLLVLVIFQAALGMWTVTLQVKPAIVTAHLLGGFATFVLLTLAALQLNATATNIPSGRQGVFRSHMVIALIVLILQITLGGWTSSNYAALGCSEFPTCYGGEWWPAMDFGEAFVLWRGLGINYEFGVLDGDARTAIHMVHRIGALVTSIIVGLLALRMVMQRESRALRLAGANMLALLMLQVALGITNVLGHLPLPIAVAHNGAAALLLLSVVISLWMSRQNLRGNLHFS